MKEEPEVLRRGRARLIEEGSATGVEKKRKDYVDCFTEEGKGGGNSATAKMHCRSLKGEETQSL